MIITIPTVVPTVVGLVRPLRSRRITFGCICIIITRITASTRGEIIP
jgi:hypothetical protein